MKSMEMIILVSLIPRMFMLLLPAALLVLLQVWLCRSGRRLGLILPGFSLCLSLPLTFLLATNLVGASPRNLAVMGLVFLVTNIPTVVFGVIWLHYKSRRDTLDDLKRMKIEDLG